MKKYRITRRDYYDNYGTLSKSYWIVQERCSFLFWDFYKTFSDREYEGCPLMFFSLEKAVNFVKTTLLPNNPKDKVIEAVEIEF